MSVSEEISAVIEEYLECIYRLQEKSGVAGTSDIEIGRASCRERVFE